MKYAKKFTFFQKYLVMSKKSSTFALAFDNEAGLPSSVGRATDS
jgi:hypothetical protein